MKSWIDSAIAALLRGGMLLSILTIMLGMTVTLARHPEKFSAHPTLLLLQETPRTVGEVVAGVAQGRGTAIMTAGLLLLIATPVARVALSIVAFAIERDRLYVFLTAAVLLILLLGFATGANASVDFPTIPPLPVASWPLPAVAEPFARELLAQVPPQVLAQKLATDPELIPPILRNLGTALMSNDPALRDPLATYISSLARASVSQNRRRLASIIAVDPLRYLEDTAFRERINTLIPDIVARMPKHVVRAVVEELTDSAALDFDTAEAAATAAHIIPRPSSARRIPFERTALHMPDDVAGPIEASFFSLSAPYFTAVEVKRFLGAVHDASPKRRLIVLCDARMRAGLAPVIRQLNVELLDDQSRAFTPWPRDPFIVARSESGGVVFINRPNVQPSREEDQNMIRALVQQLPAVLDNAWKAQWTVGPTPFHNGHILLTPNEVWISIHTVEQRALALLGIDRVPVETFKEIAGVERYIAAAEQAANELQEFYRRPVRWVHAQEILRLAGGAGFDLDSLLTILPQPDGSLHALVADVSLGVKAARDASRAEWTAVRKAYGFRDEAQRLRVEMIEAQQNGETIALQGFLDEIAAELQRKGLRVRRLPLLNVPPSLLVRKDVTRSFLITWNNVVLESSGDSRRAEGFASLLASADRRVKQLFAASGYKLDLYPPLIRSIILSGGYRCASNHLRP